MIKFFLTGAPSPDAFQNTPRVSLGGYVSSAEVANGALDSLFGSISEWSKINKASDYCMIVLKNDGGNKVNFNIRVITPTTSLTKISLAVVSPSHDGDKNIIFEKVQDKNTAPYYADFSDDSGVTIPVFKKGDVYGVWLKRDILPSAYVPVSTDVLNAAFDAGTDLEGEDDIVIDINYN